MCKTQALVSAAFRLKPRHLIRRRQDRRRYRQYLDKLGGNQRFRSASVTIYGGAENADVPVILMSA